VTEANQQTVRVKYDFQYYVLSVSKKYWMVFSRECETIWLMRKILHELK
jgi:hypothetical protein